MNRSDFLMALSRGSVHGVGEIISETPRIEQRYTTAEPKEGKPQDKRSARALVKETRAWLGRGLQKLSL
jgi:hypothetical protein